MAALANLNFVQAGGDCDKKEPTPLAVEVRESFCQANTAPHVVTSQPIDVLLGSKAASQILTHQNNLNPNDPASFLPPDTNYARKSNFNKGKSDASSSAPSPPILKSLNSLFPTNRNDDKYMKLTEYPDEWSGEVHLDVDELQLDDQLQRCLIGYFTRRFPWKQAVYSLTNALKVKHKIDFHPSGWLSSNSRLLWI